MIKLLLLRWTVALILWALHCKCKVKSVCPLSVDLEKYMTTIVAKGWRWLGRKSQHLDPAVAELEQIWSIMMLTHDRWFTYDCLYVLLYWAKLLLCPEMYCLFTTLSAEFVHGCWHRSSLLPLPSVKFKVSDIPLNFKLSLSAFSAQFPTLKDVWGMLLCISVLCG